MEPKAMGRSLVIYVLHQQDVTCQPCLPHTRPLPVLTARTGSPDRHPSNSSPVTSPWRQSLPTLSWWSKYVVIFVPYLSHRATVAAVCWVACGRRPRPGPLRLGLASQTLGTAPQTWACQRRQGTPPQRRRGTRKGLANAP